MPDELGVHADAARARETTLVERVKMSAEADRVFAATLRDAGEATLRGRRQLYAIEAEIESAVANQKALALDTPTGAREFSRFLDAKQQDIARVVSEAAGDSQTKAALLQSLGSHYVTTPAHDGVQFAGFDTFKDSPGQPFPEKPWQYDLNLKSHVKAHEPGVPGPPVSAGSVASIGDVWNELHRCFNCNFPIGGAPREFPKVGDKLPLELRVAGVKAVNLPVQVTQIQRTADEINIEFATLPGHADGVGSAIHFRFAEEGGEMHLHIRGFVGEVGPGSEGMPWSPVERGAYGALIAPATWQPYIDNLTRHIAQGKHMPTWDTP